MEDQNVNLELTLSLGSTQKMSKTTNNAIIGMDNVRVDVGSDTGAKSRPGGSTATLPPRISIQPDGTEENLGTDHPRGSGKLPILASSVGCVAERAGGIITPHVLIVNPGEDVVEKIFEFLEKISQADVCIISATGTVSSVLLLQPDVSGGLYRDEGPFEILSLNGPCFFASDAGGAQRKISMLTVFLAEPDGRVFGGAVNNLLIAATPIKLILATFKQNINKRKYTSVTSTAPNMSTDQETRRQVCLAFEFVGSESCESSLLGSKQGTY